MTNKILPLLSVVGLTATGKSDLALKIAKKALAEKITSQVEIISADSRQVYRELEIVSGADVPADFHQVESTDSTTFPYFSHQSQAINLHGISIISPDEEWSLAHFQKFARAIITDAQEKNHLVILAGGTGLYQTRVLTNEAKILIPRDEKLRINLEKKSLSELQQELYQVDESKYQQLNHSDINNPRRLIRAIEVAKDFLLHPEMKKATESSNHVELPRIFYGLKLALSELENRIRLRVAKRIQAGAINEVEKLQQRYDLRLPIFSATGVAEVTAFLAKKINQDELIDLWTKRELQYAKRQLTWWQKCPEVMWLSAAQVQNRAWWPLPEPVK